MAHTLFDNKVIAAKATDLLITKLNARNLMTIDNTLAESEGMVKTINVYTYTGEVEKLDDGEANSAGAKGALAYVGTDYRVQRAQHTFHYFDGEFMKDNNVVDMSLKGANEIMVNEMTGDFFTECAKATKEVEFANGAGIGYDIIVDAIAEVGLENETELFLVIPNAWKADLRKDEDYKNARMGEVVYGGQVGVVAGIPVIATKALTDKAYIMTKEAVALFMKEDVMVEQDRNIETKENTVVLSTYYICALVDNAKICAIAEAAA